MTSFEHNVNPPSNNAHDRGLAQRPAFSSQITMDRLRECERRPSSAKSITKVKPQRRSVFREEGLDDLRESAHRSEGADLETVPATDFMIHTDRDNETFDGILKDSENSSAEPAKKPGNIAWLAKLAKGQRPHLRSSASAPPGAFSTISRSALIVFLIALVVPAFRYRSGKDSMTISVAQAGVIRASEHVENGSLLEGRQDSPSSVCTRWAHQMANINGTVYIYGGQAKEQSGQSSDTWNKNFLTLDLTKTWQISSPSISGLPQPSGPPAVSLGSLWHSYDSLWLYGGMFSDAPMTSPLPVSTWKYDIKSSSWEEFSNPRTSAGNHSDTGDQPVQRSAEGAGLSVPELGRSWYFGGHLDSYTTMGWSNQIARVYLKSLLEYTHPGYANTGVASLGSQNAAPHEGVYRNITEGGLQDNAGFTERADGVLVYVPGWGLEGIILGLAGGTNDSFTEMNVIDVYDVANSTWYKQSTSGKSPPIRVNPCAVVAAASDGTSFNIYLYGGQNLIPFGSQIQYSDMWILTVPSFTWIEVDLSGQSEPPARAGHSCTLWDGQMVVVGGYVGKDISCDSPGVYVFNTSSLKWTGGFTSLSSGSSDSSGSQNSDPGNGKGSSVMRGSVGYQVPEPVQAVIGGSGLGGATITTPASGPATDGPIATGKPPTYTVTQSGGTVTQTSEPIAGPPPPSKQGHNIGAIVAGTVAGVLAILAAYLAFCTWLYRRQLKMYQNHVAMAQRTAFNSSPNAGSYRGSGTGSAGRFAEKPAPVLGPFGTEIAEENAAAAAPASLTDRSSHSGAPGGGRLSPNNQTVGSRPSGDDSGYAVGVYGMGATPPGGKRYGPGSEGDEITEDLNHFGRPSASTAQSSLEDLLAGQEPSFFAVILNPRRTLRVVNSD